VAFLLLLLSAVLFDGLLGTTCWCIIERWLPDASGGLLAATLGLLGVWLVFLAAYMAGCAAMAATTGPLVRFRTPDPDYSVLTCLLSSDACPRPMPV
jgi:hypothetical protein